MLCLATCIFALCVLVVLYIESNQALHGTKSQLSSAEQQLVLARLDLTSSQQQLVLARLDLTSSQQQWSLTRGQMDALLANNAWCGTYIQNWEPTDSSSSSQPLLVVTLTSANASTAQLFFQVAGRFSSPIGLLWDSATPTSTGVTWLNPRLNLGLYLDLNPIPLTSISLDTSGALTVTAVSQGAQRTFVLRRSRNSDLVGIQGIYRTSSFNVTNELRVGCYFENEKVTVIRRISSGDVLLSGGQTVPSGEMIVNTANLTRDDLGNYTVPYTSNVNTRTSGTLSWSPQTYSITLRQTSPTVLASVIYQQQLDQ
jgi:hypothetical protein